MVHEIVLTGDTRLVAANSTVEEINAEVKQIISDMKETMATNHKKSLGIAAPQIGVNKRICVIKTPLNSFVTPIEEKQFLVLINPEITKVSEEKVISREGCLSVPETVCQVIRFKSIKIKAKDENGRSLKLNFEGREAIVVQHEIDHLNSIVMTAVAHKIETKPEPVAPEPVAPDVSESITLEPEKISTVSLETAQQITEDVNNSVKETLSSASDTHPNSFSDWD